MRARSVFGVLLALLLAGSAVVMATPAQALTGTPLDCDGVVAVEGGYLLTRDTDCRMAWFESDKSFDLGGHTFTGQLQIGGPRPNRNLAVHDGTLQIRSRDSWMSADTTFSRVRIRPAPDRVPIHFFISVGSGFTLEHSVVEDVPGAAFDLYSGGTGAVFRNSIFRNNGVPFAIQKSSDVTIESNWFVENGTAVLLYPEDGDGVNRNVIRRNIFVGNSYAVYANATCNSSQCLFGAGRYPGLDNTRIEYNLILNSRSSGIAIEKRCEGSPTLPQCLTTVGNEIRGNIISGSGSDPAASPYDDGITARGSLRSGNVETPYLEALAGFRLSSNLALHNADLGFDVFGVTDGGRNLAAANGNRDQCDGVRCTLRRPPPHRQLAAGPVLEDPLLQLHSHSEADSGSST